MSLRLRPLVCSALFGLTLPLAAEQKPPFDAPLVIGHAYSRIVKTLDLDGDGWEDAIGWWRYDSPTSRLTTWMNDGTGKLTYSLSYVDFPVFDPVVDAHDASATGDLDQDGREDFVFSNRNEVRIYLSNGAAAPTLFATVPTASPVFGVVLADFDLDGELDLAMNVSGTLQIRRFDFTTITTPLVSEYVTAYVADGRLVAAELSGDSTPDLLVGGTRIYPVSAGIIGAPTTFAPGWPYDPAVSLRHDVGDIDGDGDLDVVTFRVATSEPAAYRVLRRTSGSGFAVEAARLGGPARRLFDLDADGDLDGTCCGGGGSYDSNSAPSNFRLSFNDGTGSFAPSLDITSLGSTAIAGVVDVDHDGDVDLVAGRCVYYASGPITDTPFEWVGSLQNERTLQDFDVEGDPDFGFTATSVRVNLGDGSNVTRSHALPPAPNGWQRYGDGMPGDWDGDGIVDMLVRLGSTQAPAGLEFLRNVGGGSFESKGIVAGATGLLGGPSGDLAYPTRCEDSLAKDLDGDGDLDIVIRTRSDTLNNIDLKWSCWLRNNGPQGFAFVEDFPNLVVLDAADLNEDGITDLFGVLVPMNTPLPWPERWAPGLGGGSWAPWVVIPGTSVRPTNPPDQVPIVDVDLDGDLDLVHTYAESAGVLSGRVHLNDGSGSFVQDPTMGISLNGTSQRPGAVLAADLNSDGLVDLVFGTTGTNQAGILMRRADNTTWDPPIHQVIFADQTSDLCLTSRDPDGDRDADVITSRVVNNRMYEGTQAGARRQQQDGQAGTGGIVPTLGASGPFRVGMVARLRLRGARPATTGEVRVSDASSMPLTFGPLTNANHRLARLVTLTTSGSPTDPAGSGSWLETFTVPAVYAGRTFLYEVLLNDPAAPNGRSRSNSLLLSYGW